MLDLLTYGFGLGFATLIAVTSVIGARHKQDHR